MAVPLSESLPLFPLGMVLYPGALLPLHVFEERYRDLVQTLVERPGDDPREFGVVAIRSGHEVGADSVHALYPVGCSAVLARVTPHADGRFDIVCIGSRRFRLLGVEPAGTPYLTGAVQRLGEPEGVGAAALAQRVAAGLEEYRGHLGMEPRPARAADPADPRALSYQVANAVRLELAERQALLQAPDTASRLRAEQVILHRENVLVEALSAVPAPELTRATYSLN